MPYNCGMTTHIALNDMIEALATKFGASTVATRDVCHFIEEIGQRPNRYLADLREYYSVGHGQMRFVNAESNAPVFETKKTVVETDAAIEKRINARFNALEVMSRATAKGINRAMILSGPAGVGKSHTVEQVAEEVCGDFTHVKGYIRPTGLYKTLWENRHPGKLVVFDDADSIFSDETSLNLLKAACDSSDARKIGWLSNSIMEDDAGEEIPKNFEFEGSIIFITNIDFAAQIEKGSKLAPHFEAMVSRSMYLDLSIKQKRDYIVRIKQVMNAGMMDEMLLPDEKAEIIEFMEENMDMMRELSLRMAKKLATLMLMDKKSWKELASMTCMKNS